MLDLDCPGGFSLADDQREAGGAERDRRPAVDRVAAMKSVPMRRVTG
jgi:hypothetical protein